MHVAKMLRNEFFSASFNFDGTLVAHEKAAPPIILSFLTMLLEGPGNADTINSEAALSLSQLIVFNAVKRRRNSANDAHATVTVRHTHDRETPLPIYVGLTLHSAVRKKSSLRSFTNLVCLSRMIGLCKL